MASSSRYSGQSVSRVDALGKAGGATRYLRDLIAPDAWVGAAIRSPVAAGRIRGLRIDPAFDRSGIVLVEPHEIPGVNTIAFVERDMPCLATSAVRYLGEPIALVAAPDRDTLAAALARYHGRHRPDHAVRRHRRHRRGDAALARLAARPPRPDDREG